MADKRPRPAPGAMKRGITLREAMHLQAIEGNPLTAEEVAMFEMFEREGWTHERRRAHILARVADLIAQTPAAQR